MKRTESFDDTLMNLTLGEIVNFNIQAAEVFNSYRILFFCNPNQKLVDAIQEKGIQQKNILLELTEVFENRSDESNIEKKGLRELTFYIENKHHSFVKEALKQFDGYKKYFETHAFNNEIILLIERLIREMTMHLEKEEKMIFPLIKYLVDTEKFNEKPKTRNYGTVRTPIKQLTTEHETSIELIKKIKSIINKGLNGLSVSNTTKNFESLITQFEMDLYTHIHIENNVLFLRTIELENKLIKR